MKRIIATTMAAMTVACLCSCKEEDLLVDTPIGSNATYDVMGTGEIPVGMWVTPPDGYQTEDAFRVIAESGINMVNGFGYNENTDEEVQAVLDACQANGLKYLYSSLEIEENIRAYNTSKDASLIENTMTQIGKFASHPAYAGQLFIDEPGASYFDTLSDFFDAYRAKYPEKLAYVNMLPTYALAATGCPRYEDYFDIWNEKIDPAFYSYDSYPLIDYDPAMVGYQAELSDFFYNLDLLRVKTLEQGIPMWSFIATLGYTTAVGSSEPNRRSPSREDLRWQVFCNLAFGSKGLQYFCYWTPGQDTFQNAMVDRAGNPTDTYYHVQEVNAEFEKYGSVLLNADAVGVMMNDYRRDGFDIYSTALTKFGGIQSVEGNRYVIGCFSDKDTGKKSVLISPTTPRDDIEITLNMHKSVQEVTAYIKGEMQTLKVENNKLDLSIAKGDAVFVQL